MAQQSFDDAIEEIRKSITRFQKIEGKPWGVEGAVIELTCTEYLEPMQINYSGK